MRRGSWADCDPAGTGYTPRFLGWCVEAVEQFFEEILEHPWQRLHADGIAAPFASAQLDFHSPVHVGDRLLLMLSVPRIGGSSVSWAVVGSVADRRCFSGSAVSVFVDKTTFKPVHIPDRVRGRLRSPDEPASDTSHRRVE